MKNYDNKIITDKQINSTEDIVTLSSNSEVFNFASNGVVYVDRDSHYFGRLLELALEYAKTFGVDEEINRLTIIKEKLKTTEIL